MWAAEGIPTIVWKRTRARLPGGRIHPRMSGASAPPFLVGFLVTRLQFERTKLRAQRTLNREIQVIARHDRRGQ